MIVSRSHKFIFIHIYKTAGTSILNALWPYCGPQSSKEHDIASLRADDIFHIRDLPSHMPAQTIAEMFGFRAFRNFYSFSFVRNPWDWQVSLFHYISGDPAHPLHARYRDFEDFRAYVRWLRTRPYPHTQSRWLTDHHGEIIVDFIGKYESINNDFAHVARIIGLNVDLPHLNKGERGDYRSYFDDETREIVGALFKEDIDRFDYVF